MKRGDLRPALRVKLRYQDGAADSAGLGDASSVVFNMANAETGAMVIEGGTVSIEDAATGLVRYDWEDGDTDAIGSYDAEFVVVVAGKPETFPTTGSIRIIIEPKAGDPVPHAC